jgi:hypothetical protein
MDGKRRINPQNPPRKIRGRKQKKPSVLEVLATIPPIAPGGSEVRDSAAPEDNAAPVAEPEGLLLDE